MSVISTFLSLKSQEKTLIIKTLLLGYRIRFMTWIYSFPKLQEQIRRMATSEKGDLDSDRIIWSVQATSPYVLKSTCLTNALTGQILLSRNGYQPQLRIGVMKEEEFEAHAWLEMEGEVVMGESEHDYVPLLDME